MKRLNPDEEKALANLINSINWGDPNDANKRALATDIVETVQEDIYTQDIVSLLADYRQFNPGEEIQFKTTEGLVAYVIEPGAFAPRSMRTNTVITLPKKMITVATELELTQLRSGRYGAIADIKKEAAERILGARSNMLWDVAWRAVTAGDNYASVSASASAATKKAALDSALSYMEDYTQNGAKAIVGRFSALSFLEDSYLDNDYLPDEMKMELFKKTGFMGMYRKVPVIHLKSYKDVYGVEQIDANNFLVIGDGVLKYGEVKPGLEVFDQVKGTTTHSWELAFWIMAGVAAVSTDRLYRIQLT